MFEDMNDIVKDLQTLTDSQILDISIVLAFGIMSGVFPQREGAVLAMLINNEITRRETERGVVRQNAPSTETVQ